MRIFIYFTPSECLMLPVGFFCRPELKRSNIAQLKCLPRITKMATWMKNKIYHVHKNKFFEVESWILLERQSVAYSYSLYISKYILNNYSKEQKWNKLACPRIEHNIICISVGSNFTKKRQLCNFLSVARFGWDLELSWMFGKFDHTI